MGSRGEGKGDLHTRLRELSDRDQMHIHTQDISYRVFEANRTPIAVQCYSAVAGGPAGGGGVGGVVRRQATGGRGSLNQIVDVMRIVMREAETRRAVAWLVVLSALARSKVALLGATVGSFPIVFCVISAK